MLKQSIKKYWKALLVKLDQIGFLAWYEKFIVPMGHALKRLLRGVGATALGLSALLNLSELVNSLFMKKYQPNEEPRMRWVRRLFWGSSFVMDVLKIVVYSALRLAWSGITFIVGGVVGAIYSLVCFGNSVHNYLNLRNDFYSSKNQNKLKTESIEYHENISEDIIKEQNKSYSLFKNSDNIEQKPLTFSKLKYVPDFDPAIHKKATTAQLFKEQKRQRALEMKESTVGIVTGGLILAGCVLWAVAPPVAIGLFIAGTVTQIVSSVLFKKLKSKQEKRIKQLKASIENKVKEDVEDASTLTVDTSYARVLTEVESAIVSCTKLAEKQTQPTRIRRSKSLPNLSMFSRNSDKQKPKKETGSKETAQPLDASLA